MGEQKLMHEIAALLETEVSMLPLMDALLGDLEALGCLPDVVIEMLAPLQLDGETGCFLDLGCGKGALTFALLNTFPWTGVGVDAFAPFVAAANRQAVDMGLSDRCQFFCDDARHAADLGAPFDGVLYVAMGDLLGDFETTIQFLRSLVKPNGWMLIGDVYLKQDHSKPQGYAYALTQSQAVQALTSYGDILLQQVELNEARLAELNRTNTEAIRQRANELMLQEPEQAAAIRAYVARQEAECAALEAHCVDAYWLLQRRAESKL